MTIPARGWLALRADACRSTLSSRNGSDLAFKRTYSCQNGRSILKSSQDFGTVMASEVAKGDRREQDPIRQHLQAAMGLQKQCPNHKFYVPRGRVRSASARSSKPESLVKTPEKD